MAWWLNGMLGNVVIVPPTITVEQTRYIHRTDETIRNIEENHSEILLITQTVTRDGEV